MLNGQVIESIFESGTFGFGISVDRYNLILTRLSKEYSSYNSRDRSTIEKSSQAVSTKSAIYRVSSEDMGKIHENVISISFNHFYPYLMQRLDDSFFSHPIVSILGDLLNYRNELKSLPYELSTSKHQLISDIKAFINYTHGMINNNDSILRINADIAGHYSIGELLSGEGMSYWNRLYKALSKLGYRIIYIDTDHCFIVGSTNVIGLEGILAGGDYPTYDISHYDYMVIPKKKHIICMSMVNGKLSRVVYNSRVIYR